MKILLLTFILSMSFFASASDCTGGQECSTNNVKNDFRIYSTSGFGFTRSDDQEHHVTYQALEIIHHGLCSQKYCPVKYRLKGDSDGQYRTGYIHQNGFRDRGATATGLTQVVNPAQEAPQVRNDIPVPMPRINREEVSPNSEVKDQISNVKKDFRIYSADDFKFKRDGSSVDNVTRNATEMVFMGECHRKYCLVKYKVAGESHWREGYVHQNGFLDRGASAKESTLPVNTNVARPEVVEEQPKDEPVEETKNNNDSANDQALEAERQRQRQLEDAAAKALKEAERQKAAELAAERKKAAEEAERKRRENADPCIAELKKNVCANNQSEVKNSKPLMCKLKKMGGNENSIFRKFYDAKMGVTVEVKTTGQYSIRMGILQLSSGSGQVCLSGGDLRLKAGDVNMKLNNLNRIRHKYGEHDLDLVAQ